MDLVDSATRKQVYASRVEELRRKSEGWGTRINCFATSIWDETLYKAWSKIIHTLIPNVSALESDLNSFANICNAEEVVLFERTTFLVIAKSSDGKTKSKSKKKSVMDLDSDSSKDLTTGNHSSNADKSKDRDKSLGDKEKEKEIEKQDLMKGFPEDLDKVGREAGLHPERFEKVSELVKKFKLSCSKLQSQFQGVEIRGATYTCYLDVLTANTYIMIIVSDPRIQLAAIKLNVELSREHFEKLQAINISR